MRMQRACWGFVISGVERGAGCLLKLAQRRAKEVLLGLKNKHFEKSGSSVEGLSFTKEETQKKKSTYFTSAFLV